MRRPSFRGYTLMGSNDPSHESSADSPIDRLLSVEHEEFEHIVALLKHLRLNWLLRHFPPRIIHALYVLVNGFITVAILAALAFATGSPFVFPSVGPSAYLFFFTPMAKSASPRHAILGHAIGLICGYIAFMVTGASAFPFSAHVGFHWPLIFSAALSLSATGAIMILLRVSHPPAGATTLIVSLGIIYHPRDLVIIEIAVVLLALQAFCINRLAGVQYPLWSPRKTAASPAS
jgi:CBS domain-containing membrane protein